MSLSEDFAAFMAGTPAVRFGDFTLRSGMKTPVFFNFGDLCSGAHLAAMGSFFARGIVENGLTEADVLYGPAYKGIVIAAATSQALWRDHRVDIPIAYNRKETKQHGEGGDIIGADLAGKSVLMLDDVIADGSTKHETAAKLQALGARVAAVVIGIDRQDVMDSKRTALEIFRAATSIPVVALTTGAAILKRRG
ncbi:MAG: orotate phosphoribosyltransferase [Hyphomonadaceae bacterium]